MPASGVVLGELAQLLRRLDHSGNASRQVDRRGLLARQGGLATEPTPQVVGEHRSEEWHVDQAPRELLRDDGHLDPRCAVGPQRAKSRGVDRLLQPAYPIRVVEICDRSGPEIVGQLGRRLAQLLLFTGQTDVHRRSFNTLRNTFPDGSRGISSTNTTRFGRLYDASRSPTSAMSSSASTGPHVLTAATTASPVAASGTPNTAQSSTAACPWSTASISAGAT